MPPFLPPLLAALLLSLLTFVVSYPVALSSFRVDVLGLFLVVFALVNLRLAFRAARIGEGSGAGRVPLWFWVLGLAVAALITFRVIHALNP